MPKFIEYIFDSTWVSGHCMLSTDTLAGLAGYELSVPQSCCAPNAYLVSRPELLRGNDNACLLPELFLSKPSFESMQLIEHTVAIDASFATAAIRNSLISSNKVNGGYIEKDVLTMFSVSRPVLSDLIVREIFGCGLECIEQLSLHSIKFLASWLYTSPSPNEILFILASFLVPGRESKTNTVVRISKAMSEPKFSGVRGEVEALFVSSIERGYMFQTAVFENFELAVGEGRINSNTVGFLAFGVKYEMYVPQTLEIAKLFTELLENSKSQAHNLMELSVSFRKQYARDPNPADQEDDQREAQATLALDALCRLTALHLEQTPQSVETHKSVLSIVQYIAEKEYMFVQSKYRMRALLHKVAEIAAAHNQLAELKQVMQAIIEHDANVPKAFLDKYALQVAKSSDAGEKDSKTLLSEMRILNRESLVVAQPELERIIDYVTAKLAKVKQERVTFGFKNYRKLSIHKHHKKPGEIKSNEVHLYNYNGTPRLRWQDYEGMLVDIAVTEPDYMEQFEYVFIGFKSVDDPENSEIICRIVGCMQAWTSDQFQLWAEGIKSVDDSTIAEIIAVLDFAYHLTVAKEKFFMRDHQIIAVLLRIKYPSLIVEIETGGGKSLIVTIINGIEALSGLIGHTITASPTLVVRDLEDQKLFYDMLGIGVSHNILGGVPNPAYNAGRVYCDIRRLLADNLRNLKTFVMETSDVDAINIDEIDILLLDQAIMKGTKIQLSDPIPGFEYLRPAFQLIWSFQHYTRSFIAASGYQYIVSDGAYCHIHENGTAVDCVIQEEMQALIKDHVVSFIAQNLETPQLPVPNHLRHFIKDHLKRWVDSVLKAIIFQKGDEYIVYNRTRNSKNLTIIAPVDDATGTIQSSLILSGGLTQFLQIKEELYQAPESLTSVFTSYVGYFLRHTGRMSGVTGTSGKPWLQKFLNDTYGVKSIILPKFKKTQSFKHSMIIAPDQQLWLKEIVAHVKNATAHSRAVLVINPSINKMEMLVREFKSQLANTVNIKKYFDGEANKDVVKCLLRPGDVIVATNAAGRGTDLKNSREVLKAGGLTVIQTSFAKSWRTSAQAEGRAGRNGEPGSSVVIINAQMYPMDVCGADEDIAACFERERDREEIAMLERLTVCDLPGKKREEWLFQENVRHARIATSSTGFEIVMAHNLDALDASSKQEQNQLYIYTVDVKGGGFWREIDEGFGFKIYLRAPERTAIDITSMIVQLNHKALLHMRTVLARPGMTLNGHSYDIIHFIAAYNGLSPKNDMIGRVIAKYEQLWPVQYATATLDFGVALGAIFGKSKTTELQKKLGVFKAPTVGVFVQPEEHFFLEDIANQTRGKMAAANASVKTIKNAEIQYMAERLCSIELDQRPQLCELDFTKLRKLFELWREDLELYKDKQLIQEREQQFGMHYTNHLHLILGHPECNASDVEGEKRRHETMDIQLRNATAVFFKLLSEGEMTNPAYLLHRAYAYEQIDQKQGPIEGNLVIRGKYKFISQEAPGYLAAAMNFVSNFIPSNFDFFVSLKKGVVSSDFYLQSAISKAFKCANQAVKAAGEFHNWWGYNALAYFKLRRDGNYITHVEDASRAVEVMKEFAVNQAIAAQTLNRYVDLLEAYLDKFLMEGHVSHQSKFAIHKKVEIEQLRAIVRFMVANVDEVRRAFAAFQKGPSMIRIKEVLSSTQLVKMINVAAVQEFSQRENAGGSSASEAPLPIEGDRADILGAARVRAATVEEFNETDFDISDIESFEINNTKSSSSTICNGTDSNSTRASVPFINMTAMRQVPSQDDIEAEALIVLDEIQLAGGLNVYSIESYRLKKNKDFLDKIVPIVFGIIQVAIGIALLNPAIAANALVATAATNAALATGATAAAAAAAGTTAAAASVSIFTTSLATSLIAAGVGDLVMSAVAIAKGTPIDLGNYLKSKATGLAISLITAGALHALGSIESLRIAATTSKFLSGMHKAGGMATYIAAQFAFQGTMVGMSHLAHRAAQHYAKKNAGDIKHQARNVGYGLVRDNERALLKIFAHDAVYSTSKTEALVDYASKVVSDYSARFQGEGAQVSKGVGSGVAGKVAGGFDVAGQVWQAVINLGTEIPLSVVKMAEASSEFRAKMRAEILRVSEELPGSYDMMLELLQNNHEMLNAQMGVTIGSRANKIMIQLLMDGFTTDMEDKEIDYNHCSRLNTINLGDFAEVRSTVCAACDRVARAYGVNGAADGTAARVSVGMGGGSGIGVSAFAVDVGYVGARARLADALASRFKDGLMGTFTTGIIQPILQIPGTLFAGQFSEWTAEKLRTAGAFGQEARSEKQSPQPDDADKSTDADFEQTEQAEPIPLSKKSTKPSAKIAKPTGRKLPADQSPPETSGTAKPKRPGIPLPKFKQDQPLMCLFSPATCADGVTPDSAQASKTRLVPGRTTEGRDINMVLTPEALTRQKDMTRMAIADAVFGVGGDKKAEAVSRRLGEYGVENVQVFDTYADRRNIVNSAGMRATYLDGTSDLVYVIAGVEPVSSSSFETVRDLAEYGRYFTAAGRAVGKLSNFWRGHGEVINALDGGALAYDPVYAAADKTEWNHILPARVDFHVENMQTLSTQLRPGEKLILVAYSGGCGEGTAARARAPHLASEAHLFDPIGVEPEVDMITRNNPAVKSFVYSTTSVYNFRPNLVNWIGKHGDGVKTYLINSPTHSIYDGVEAYKQTGKVELSPNFFSAGGIFGADGNSYRLVTDMSTTAANLASKFNVHIDQVQEVFVLPVQNIHKTFIMHFQKQGQSS